MRTIFASALAIATASAVGDENFKSYNEILRERQANSPQLRHGDDSYYHHQPYHHDWHSNYLEETSRFHHEPMYHHDVPHHDTPHYGDEYYSHHGDGHYGDGHYAHHGDEYYGHHGDGHYGDEHYAYHGDGHYAHHGDEHYAHHGDEYYGHHGDGHYAHHGDEHYAHHAYNVNGVRPPAADDFHTPEYLLLSAKEKQDRIWTQVMADTQSGSWLQLATVLAETMSPTMDTPGDVLPCSWFSPLIGCRPKGIHSVGVVGKIKFVANPDNNLYDGIFKGADYGIIRLSTAIPTLPILKEMTPGMGIKFLRDYVDSANIVGMYSVDGQPSYNFFEHDWSNHVPDVKGAKLIPLAEKFSLVSKFIQTIGLSDMAHYDQKGNLSSD